MPSTWFQHKFLEVCYWFPIVGGYAKNPFIEPSQLKSFACSLPDYTIDQEKLCDDNEHGGHKSSELNICFQLCVNFAFLLFEILKLLGNSHVTLLLRIVQLNPYFEN